MGFWMGIWAIVSALTALAKDYKGLLLTRVFFGVTEAPFYVRLAIAREDVVVMLLQSS